MKVFVVGITGVLGRALLPQLRQRGHVIRTLARTLEKMHALEDAGVEAIQGDLLAPSTIEHLASHISDCQAVVHIATAIPHDPTHPDPDAWRATTRLRTEGTQALLAAALAAKVKRYIQQSTIMAYPNGGDFWLQENVPLDSAPTRAVTCAPVIKMEEIIHSIHPSQIHWCILRAGQFVGPGTDQEKRIEALRAGHQVVPGRGQSYLSLVHVSDMASAITTALDSAPAGSTFNIVDEPLQNGDYLDRLANMLHVPHPIRQSELPEPPSFRCSNEAARTRLHWTPEHGIWPEEEQLGIAPTVTSTAIHVKHTHA
ncbi:NAD-dependent epimerase/dehydratase family protein [Ktedonospora formicarum]|uniref:dTDP-glucose 4,6-dehydratase n=1 Tax=Ktedonospora formicarum TaxID=2778364 RepID=A0A8J3HWQ3_9CHLR|nr:NAD(P)-dependent oxidoreductase [Ktedonospora formicarum]GHO43411.1 dTDP-glucose 4,6-dehydratase [Ktedonospora formicarum]